MNKISPPPRWYTPWRNNEQPPYDPADVGTAFGLDLSLCEIHDAQLPAGVGAAAGGAGGVGDAGWLQRWAARRRTSD